MNELLWQAPLLALVGSIAGFLNVLAGGGSLLTLPVLIFLGLPAATANGTNRVAIFIQNISAISGFRKQGVFPWRISLLCTLPALAGAWLGANLAVDIDDQLFKRLLAIIMIGVLIFTAWDPMKRIRVEKMHLTPLRTAALLVSFFFVGIYGGFVQAGVGFLIITALPVGAFGERLGIELNANTSDLEGKVDVRVPNYEADIFLGAGGLYNEDNYFIANGNCFIRDEVFSPALTLGIGFKALVGEVELSRIDYDLASMNFALFGRYDFRKNYYDMPFSVEVGVSGATKPLCFNDTERYIDCTGAVYGHIVHNAAILVGGRYLDMRFDRGAGEVKTKEYAIFFGCKLFI